MPRHLMPYTVSLQPSVHENESITPSISLSLYIYISALVPLGECWYPKRSLFSNHLLGKGIPFSVEGMTFVFKYGKRYSRGKWGESSQVLNVGVCLAVTAKQAETCYMHSVCCYICTLSVP